MTELRCRPGDLARVIEPGCFKACPFCGSRAVLIPPRTVVSCESLIDGDKWVIEQPLHTIGEFDCGMHFATIVRAIADEMLEPIRDPGDPLFAEALKSLDKVREVQHG
jgi:hypothetical protein